MDRDDRPIVEDPTDLYAELREQRGLEILREGLLDSTYIDVSRQGSPLNEDEYIEESGD